MSDLRTRIRHFIATEIMLTDDLSAVTEKTRLIGGVMDSLGQMQLVAYLQDEFGIRFEDGEIVPDNFRTVSDVEMLVEQKVGAKGAAARAGSAAQGPVS